MEFLAGLPLVDKLLVGLFLLVVIYGVIYFVKHERSR